MALVAILLVLALVFGVGAFVTAAKWLLIFTLVLALAALLSA